MTFEGSGLRHRCSGLSSLEWALERVLGDTTFESLGFGVEPPGFGVDAQGARARRLRVDGLPALILGLRGAPGDSGPSEAMVIYLIVNGWQ